MARPKDTRALRVIEDDAATPPVCPHCEAPPPAWQMGTDEAWCFYCGARWMRRWHVAVAGR